MGALPMFLDKVPTYEVVDGQMHIGMGAVGLVMSVPNFLQGCLKGKDAIARWQVEQLGVEPGKIYQLR